MHSQHCTVIALLMVLAAARAHAAPAQSTYKPCSLVTKSEAEALSGQKVTKSGETNFPYKKDANNDHDGVMSNCAYILSPGKEVSLTVGSVPVTAPGKAKGEATTKRATALLK